MPETNTVTTAKPPFDVDKIRKDFPVLAQEARGKPLVYLDNAATTQKPWSVINRVYKFDSEEYGTVRRGAYHASERATMLYEEARQKLADFIGAADKKEIIITSGATQSINLVAHSFGRKFIGSGDEVIISNIEHHANTVPWQVLCEETGAILKVIPVNDRGELIMEEYDRLLGPKTKLVSVNHISNALGTVNPVEEIIAKAHSVGAKVLIDGAQSVPHMKINVQELDCDFYAFSGHKMYGPSGVGGLFGKMEALETMGPYVTGGDMIRHVTLEKSTFAEPPARFEAGTPPISQVIGLGEAVDYLNKIGIDKIYEYELSLLEYGTKALNEVEGLRIIGTAENKASILSFDIANIHPHDVVTLLDQDGIAVRGGHHCAQPLMESLGLEATTRASLALYNGAEDTAAFLDAMGDALRVLG